MQDFGINLKHLQTSAKIALMISFGSSSCTSSLIPEPQVICAKNTSCSISTTNPECKHAGRKYSHCDVLLPFLVWTDNDDLSPAVSAMEPEVEVGVRRKTPERRWVFRRMRLLQGCLMATPSADLLADELPVDEAELLNKKVKKECLRNILNTYQLED